MQDPRARGVDEGWMPASALLPAELRPYLDRFERLNPLQAQAVPTVLSATGHVMVVAPTSSGKTLIGEVAALRSILTDGKPAVWLLPARALAAEVAQTARRWKELGIATVELTGETNMSSDAVRRAQLWVATTEKFEALSRRASLRDVVGRIGCLVIDEVHMVGDPARGATLESLIARLRTAEGGARIVALSATVSNAEELAGWFHAELISSAWRPTSLTTELVAYDNPERGRREDHESAKDSVVVPLLRRLVGGTAEPEQAASSVVVFCGSKAAVLRTAALAAGVPFRGVELESVVDACFRRGVGIHFRDAPGAGRALEAFRARRLRVLIATSGLSTGVNTPAKYVVIRDLELGMTPLEVSQAQQMLGRAGRAGHEEAGFGFLLVPRAEEQTWAAKLGEGYAARSRLAAQLGDAILAEMLRGSIVDRTGARSWFEQTLAFAQSRVPVDIDRVVDDLVRHGFAVEAEGRITPSEVGVLTSRLMVDVDSARQLLRALADLPVPRSADEAEELVLQAVVTAVVSLRERPVNERTYTAHVDGLLARWSPRAVARAGEWFGARLCLAAAQIALRAPERMRENPPVGVAMAEFRRAVDDMPRYLAWVSALGYARASTWVPAVAGDLARRLTWWQLTPHPARGGGRLLWMLERMLEPQHHRDRLPDLWRRARAAGFDGPDRIAARPRGVDVSAEGFAAITAARAGLALGGLEGTALDYRSDSPQARITAWSSTGAGHAVASVRPADGALGIRAPAGARGPIAADVFLYTRDGDFAYGSVVGELPDPGLASRPIDDVGDLLDALPPGGSGLAHPRGVRRLFQGERKGLQDGIRPLIAADPALLPLARALSERHDATDAAVVALRSRLRTLLRASNRTDLRSPRAVLASREATEAEVQVTLAALVATLGADAGIATAEGHPLAVVRSDDRWALAAPLHADPGRIEPLLPGVLPGPLTVLADPGSKTFSSVVEPQTPWMGEFAP